MLICFCLAVTNIVCRAVLTGGFDCNVIHYDFSKTTPVCVYNLFDVSSGGPQIVNPPYVYGVDFTPDGQFSCSALGDGSIDFLHLGLQDRIGRTEMAHASAVSQAYDTLSAANREHGKLCLSI